MPYFLVDLPISTKKGPCQAACLKQHISLQPLQAFQGESKQALNSEQAERWADSLDAYLTRVEAMHACRIRDYTSDSHSLFLRHFFSGRHPAPHLSPVPGLFLVRKEWTESVCDVNTVNTALWLQEQFPQVLFTSSEARMHSPRLQTMLVLKVHMPSPE